MGWLKSLYRGNDTAWGYAHKNTDFNMYLTVSQTGEMDNEGQFTARDMDTSSFEKPRVGYRYKCPLSFVGEFNFLIKLCQEAGDDKNLEQVFRAALLFRNEYEKNFEFEGQLNLYLQLYPTDLELMVGKKYKIPPFNQINLQGDDSGGDLKKEFPIAEAENSTGNAPQAVIPKPSAVINNSPTSTPAPSAPAYKPSHTDPYRQAGQEILSGNVDPAVWARSMVEGAGNEGAVKVAYVKLRVAQLNAAIEAEDARINAEEQRALEEAAEEKRRENRSAAWAIAEAARVKDEEQRRRADAEAAWAIRSTAARANAEEVSWFSNNKKWVVVAASLLVSVGGFISVGGMKGVYDFIYTPRCQLDVPPSCAPSKPTVPATASAKPNVVDLKQPSEPVTDTKASTEQIPSPALTQSEPQVVPQPIAISGTLKPPPYPPISVRLHEQGTTTINLVIGIDGVVKDATLKDTSGSDRLDIAAIDFVKKHWRWEPAAQEAPTTVQVTWKLEDK